MCESHEHGRSAEPTITAGCERSPDVESQPTSQILPFLYLGNGRDADDPVTLDRLGISRVLNVTSDLACGKHLRSRGILYKQLPALDSGHQNLRQYFDDAYHFIGTKAPACTLGGGANSRANDARTGDGRRATGTGKANRRVLDCGTFAGSRSLARQVSLG